MSKTAFSADGIFDFNSTENKFSKITNRKIFLDKFRNDKFIFIGKSTLKPRDTFQLSHSETVKYCRSHFTPFLLSKAIIAMGYEKVPYIPIYELLKVPVLLSDLNLVPSTLEVAAKTMRTGFLRTMIWTFLTTMMKTQQFWMI
jgi:hypothetical protein